MLTKVRTLAGLLVRPPGGRVGERICFIHVPKCGGTSFGEALAREYGLVARLGGRLATVDPVVSKRAAAVAGQPLSRYREALLLYHLGHPRTRFVAGHVEYSPRGHDAFPDWRYVTLLRDPVAKWFSQYFYNRYKESDHSRVELELEDFLATPAARDYGSDYVRFFARAKDADLRSEAAIADALAGLERFAVVGVLEELERFLADFEAAFGVRPRVPHRNASPAPRARREVPAEVRRAVERLCAPNRAVYRAVRARLGLEPGPAVAAVDGVGTASPRTAALPVDTPGDTA